MMSSDTRYLDNRSASEIMEERLQLLSQELFLIKTGFQERMDRELNHKVSVIEEKLKKEEAKRQESTNHLTLLLTDMEKRFQTILAQRETEIYSSLYHFRIFRWKIEGSVGNSPYIDIPQFQLFVNECSGLRSEQIGCSHRYDLCFTPVKPKDFHLSYSLLDAPETSLESSSKIHIPWSSVTIYFRFLEPIQLKMILYNVVHTFNGLPAKWVLEGTNDEKVWTLLSAQEFKPYLSTPSAPIDIPIHLRTYKQT
jgi:hypothetical protein